MSDQRDRSLDGARGLAILLVVLYHTTLFGQATSALDALVVSVPRLGWSGVDLFFVLSGFLITRILLRERERSNYFKAFYARRILRIFPLYYSLLLLTFVVIPQFDRFASVNYFWSPGSDQESIWYWFFVSNFHVGTTGAFQHELVGITWSLAIEEQFYLVWPLLVWMLSQAALRRVCCSMIGFAFVLRCYFLWQGGHPLAVYVVTPFRMDTLAVGALIAVVSRSEGGIDRLARAARPGLPISLAAIAVLSTVLVVDPVLVGAPRGYTLLGQPLMQTLGYSLLAAFYGFLVIHLLARPDSRLTRGFEARWLLTLGKYSYALYLLHFPATWIMGTWVFDPNRYAWPFLAEQAVWYSGIMTISLAGAWLSWRLIESPAQRFRKYFPYTDQRTSSP